MRLGPGQSKHSPCSQSQQSAGACRSAWRPGGAGSGAPGTCLGPRVAGAPGRIPVSFLLSLGVCLLPPTDSLSWQRAGRNPGPGVRSAEFQTHFCPVCCRALAAFITKIVSPCRRPALTFCASSKSGRREQNSSRPKQGQRVGGWVRELGVAVSGGSGACAWLPCSLSLSHCLPWVLLPCWELPGWTMTRGLQGMVSLCSSLGAAHPSSPNSSWSP